MACTAAGGLIEVSAALLLTGALAPNPAMATPTKASEETAAIAAADPLVLNPSGVCGRKRASTDCFKTITPRRDRWQ